METPSTTAMGHLAGQAETPPTTAMDHLTDSLVHRFTEATVPQQGAVETQFMGTVNFTAIDLPDD